MGLLACFVAFGAVLILVGTIFVASKYGRFALSPRFWRELRTFSAVWEKRFKRSPGEYGYIKYHEDRFGTIWELEDRELKALEGFCSSMDSLRKLRSRQRLVEVVDPTTKEVYYLSVPMIAQCSTGRGAVAWTFSLHTYEYNPIMET